MTGEDVVISEIKSFYEQMKQAGKTSVRWEELPPIVRAILRSKYNIELSGIGISALYQLIKELEEEARLKNLPPLQLSEEEKEAFRKAVEEADREFKDPTRVGSEDYEEVVRNLAEYLQIYGEERPAPGEIAELLLEKFYFATMSDTEELYLYSGGVYKPIGESFVKRILQDIFREAGMVSKLNSHYVSEVIEHIKRSTLHHRSEFDRDIYIINVKNGLLDIRTLELRPHDPDYLSVIQLPVEWNPKAQCPRWDQFIREIVDEEDARVLQEFAGYLLLRDCRFQKALMLVGSGANGKSTFLNIIIKVLGRHNCAFRSLQELTTNRFAPADLYGKLANIYDDLPPETLTNTGIFKILVTGGEIQAEKKFKHPFKFRNFAKLVFSANKVPSTSDSSKAFFRRWIIINFPNEFTGDKCDPFLEEKLSQPECLSYVLRWMVEGLRRLLEQGRFSYEDDIDTIEDKYLRAANPAYAFFQDCVIEDEEGFVSKDELYRAFVDYCKANKLPAVSKRTFGDHVKRWLRASDGWARVNGRMVRVWRGIRLKQANAEG